MLHHNFNLNALTSGSYNLIMHIDKFLNDWAVQLSGNKNFTLPGTITPQTINLIPGDIAPLPHGDNIIDIQDYNYMVSCLSGTIPMVTCITNADLNFDGKVDEQDMQFILDNFGTNGASFSTPEFTCVTDPACAQKNSKTIQLCPLKCSKIIPK